MIFFQTMTTIVQLTKQTTNRRVSPPACLELRDDRRFEMLDDLLADLDGCLEMICCIFLAHVFLHVFAIFW